MTVEDVAKGPDTGDGPAPGKWTIASGKSDGITPGFTILDSAGDRWFIKFDPPKWREMASGAEVAVTKLFHALGYHVPENHVTQLTREISSIGERSTITAADGGERRLTDARHRPAVANGGAGGRRLLPRHRQQGGRRASQSARSCTPARGPTTRTTSCRTSIGASCAALRVFAAWTNHVDTKAINSLDTLVTAERPRRRAASPDRLRLDAGQRVDQAARVRRGPSLHRRSGPDAEGHRSASASTSRRSTSSTTRTIRVGRPFLGRPLRSAGVEAARAEPGVSSARGPTTRSGRRGA